MDNLWYYCRGWREEKRLPLGERTPRREPDEEAVERRNEEGLGGEREGERVGKCKYEGFSVRADVLVQDPGTNFLKHLFIL